MAYLELTDESEGERYETKDFFFHTIGEPVPVKPTAEGDDDSKPYDLESLPSQPLAVSEQLRLIFVAHSSGFCVARTGVMIEAAEVMQDNGNGSSVMELSLVYVSIGKVRILSLSHDSSKLAASVGRNIYFFSVESLLQMEQEPFFVCSIEESSFLKDFRWVEKYGNPFIMLANDGKLYNGNIGSLPESLMDDVDAVDVLGNFTVVARGNTLRILSSTFTKILCISLSFKSWTNDSTEDPCVKVDSVRWIVPGCIVLGCCKLNADGTEKDYFVETIRTNSGRFIHRAEDSSQVVAEYFYDVFADMTNDILPTGDGPYLIFNYPDQFCGFAMAANRRNRDMHIVMFRRRFRSRLKMMDIDRDVFLPRIELQENGDDNLILGFCLEELFTFEEVEVRREDYGGGRRGPHVLLATHIVYCLTLDGKIKMFKFSMARLGRRGTHVKELFLTGVRVLHLPRSCITAS